VTVGAATDPLFTAVLAMWLICSEAVDRKRFAGLVIEFASAARLVGSGRVEKKSATARSRDKGVKRAAGAPKRAGSPA
jgi:hypothetical protein